MFQKHVEGLIDGKFQTFFPKCGFNECDFRATFGRGRIVEPGLAIRVKPLSHPTNVTNERESCVKRNLYVRNCVWSVDYEILILTSCVLLTPQFSPVSFPKNELIYKLTKSKRETTWDETYKSPRNGCSEIFLPLVPSREEGSMTMNCSDTMSV